MAGAEQTFRQQFPLGGLEHFLRGLPPIFVNRGHAPKRIHTIADFRLTTESIDADLRTMLRKHTRRIATFRENGARAHGQIFGGVCDGFADRFSNRITMILAAAGPWRRSAPDTR